MAICELLRVSEDYGGGEAKVRALRDVSLSIDTGEFTVISGLSGSGNQGIGLADDVEGGGQWGHDHRAP